MKNKIENFGRNNNPSGGRVFVSSIILVIAVIIFLSLIGRSACAQETQERIGFAGASFVASSEKDYGFGIEVATIKNSVGFGIQTEYIPENSEKTSFTFARAFLLWKVTEDFYIRTAAGVESQKTPGSTADTYASFGFGPMFMISKTKMYLGLQPNFVFETDALLISNVSFIIGLKL